MFLDGDDDFITDIWSFIQHEKNIIDVEVPVIYLFAISVGLKDGRSS